jgi:hypothetical protein
MVLDPREEIREKRFMSKRRAGRPAAFGKTAASRFDGAEMRGGADPLDLPFTDERQVVPATALEAREFEARGTGMEGEGPTSSIAI